jgi:hypothetical protein
VEATGLAGIDASDALLRMGLWSAHLFPTLEGERACPRSGLRRRAAIVRAAIVQQILVRLCGSFPDLNTFKRSTTFQIYLGLDTRSVQPTAIAQQSL